MSDCACAKLAPYTPTHYTPASGERPAVCAVNTPPGGGSVRYYPDCEPSPCKDVVCASHESCWHGKCIDTTLVESLNTWVSDTGCDGMRQLSRASCHRSTEDPGTPIELPVPLPPDCRAAIESGQACYTGFIDCVHREYRAHRCAEQNTAAICGACLKNALKVCINDTAIFERNTIVAALEGGESAELRSLLQSAGLSNAEVAHRLTKGADIDTVDEAALSRHCEGAARRRQAAMQSHGCIYDATINRWVLPGDGTSACTAENIRGEITDFSEDPLVPTGPTNHWLNPF